MGICADYLIKTNLTVMPAFYLFWWLLFICNRDYIGILFPCEVSQECSSGL